MRDRLIKEAFIKYLQQETDERFFQALTNFCRLPYIGSANTPNGSGWRDLWYVEGDKDISWMGEELKSE